MPPQITCASALPGKTENNENRIFTQMLYQCIAWIQPAVWYLQSFWLTTHTHDAAWLRKSRNRCVQPPGLLGVWFRRKEIERAAGVGLCCTHSAPVRCLLGFLFRKVMQKHYGGEVGKQSIVWFLTFLVTLLPKIILIGLRMSRLQKVKGGTFSETRCSTYSM